jgi:hypothetical protein
VARFGEVTGAILGIVNPPGEALHLEDLAAQQPQLHLVGRAGALRAVLEPGALEVLDNATLLDELLGDRIAEDVQLPVGAPEVEKAAAIAQMVSGGGKVDGLQQG